jgi:hypothetical protein
MISVNYITPTLWQISLPSCLSLRVIDVSSTNVPFLLNLVDMANYNSHFSDRQSLQ